MSKDLAQVVVHGDLGPSCLAKGFRCTQVVQLGKKSRHQLGVLVLVQWATAVRLGSRLGSRLQCYIMVQIETARNTRPLRFQIFTNDFAM